MCVQIATAGQRVGLWLLAFMAMATGLNAGAYLPITGPAPLRFEVKRKPVALLAMTPPAPEKAPDKSLSTTATPVVLPDSVTPISTETNAAYAETTETPSFAAHSAADNVLVVTPQLVADYFRPFPGATNAAASAYVPIPVGFTPPVGKNAGSSRATYKVQ